jgi:hypothetical protein
LGFAETGINVMVAWILILNLLSVCFAAAPVSFQDPLKQEPKHGATTPEAEKSTSPSEAGASVPILLEAEENSASISPAPPAGTQPMNNGYAPNDNSSIATMAIVVDGKIESQFKFFEGQKLQDRIRAFIEAELGPVAANRLKWDSFRIRQFAASFRDPNGSVPSAGTNAEEALITLRLREDLLPELQKDWRSYLGRNRLAETAVIVVMVLAVLLTAFVFLQANHATRGLYQGRLQLAAGMGILCVIGLTSLAATWIDWV